MHESVSISVNGKTMTVPRGIVVAAAIAKAGQMHFRQSVTGEARGSLCGMGICMECRVTIDGQAHRRSCQTLCEEGMDIRTDG